MRQSVNSFSCICVQLLMRIDPLIVEGLPILVWDLQSLALYEGLLEVVKC